MQVQQLRGNRSRGRLFSTDRACPWLDEITPAVKAGRGVTALLATVVPMTRLPVDYATGIATARCRWQLDYGPSAAGSSV